MCLNFGMGELVYSGAIGVVSPTELLRELATESLLRLIPSGRLRPRGAGICSPLNELDRLTGRLNVGSLALFCSSMCTAFHVGWVWVGDDLGGGGLWVGGVACCFCGGFDQWSRRWCSWSGCWEVGRLMRWTVDRVGFGFTSSIICFCFH